MRADGARRLVLGLRMRLLGALLLTSVATLGVAALALLSPLEQRLRSQGESTTVNALKSSYRELSELPLNPQTQLPQQDALEGAVHSLRTRAHATSVTVLEGNNLLGPVDSYPPATQNLGNYYRQATRALSKHGLVETLEGEEFVVARRVKIGAVNHHGGRWFVIVVDAHLQYIVSVAHVVSGAFILAAAAGLGIALLLGIGLTNTLLRRLRRLRDATRELEHRGLDAPLPLDEGHDEVSELTRAFVSLRSRLVSQESARRAFVATASHELRTPLASLNGMLELIEEDLEEGRLDLADARERTERAREQTLRLSQLSIDLLDLSRIDAEVDMRKEPLELNELCRAVAAEFEHQREERMVDVEIEQPEEACWVIGDPGAVARIVRILIDNALRFAPRGSRVEVSDRARGGRGLVLVRDHGPGVPEKERELIFERFQRGSMTGGRAGFGLGLAIGRELARRMGGSLELVANEPEEGGACFALELPGAPIGTIPGNGLADLAPGRGRSR